MWWVEPCSIFVRGAFRVLQLLKDIDEKYPLSISAILLADYVERYLII